MMDRDLQHLKALWQEKKSTSLEIDPLVEYLKKVDEIRQYRGVIGWVLYLFTVFIFWYNISFTLYNTVALILVGFGLFVLSIALYKSRTKVVYSALNLRNIDFLKYTINRLKLRLQVPRLQMLVFIVCFSIALNIELWVWLNDVEVFFRILGHLSTVLLAFLMLIIRRFGMEMYVKQINPLIKRLEKINIDE